MSGDFMISEDPVNDALFDLLHESVERGVSMSGKRFRVERAVTNYVLLGVKITVITDGGEWPMWFGLNGHRLFFIAYNMCSKDTALSDFKFCFGGAKKVGWEFNYEPFTSNGEVCTSIWGTCLTDINQSMAVPAEVGVNEARSQYFDGKIRISDYGKFWMTDVAMMIQSYVRTCERCGHMAPLSVEPAPL